MNEVRACYKKDEILEDGREIIKSEYSHIQVRKAAKVNGVVKELYSHPDIVEITRALELANDVWKERKSFMTKLEAQALVQNLINDFFYSLVKK